MLPAHASLIGAPKAALAPFDGKGKRDLGFALSPSSDRDVGRQDTTATSLEKGTFLDRTLVLLGVGSEAFLSKVMGQMTAHRQPRRRAKNTEIANEQQLLGCLIANGLRCCWYRASPLVSYQRKADASYYSEPNRPPWLSAKAIGRAVEALSEMGFLDRQIGERGVSSAYSVRKELVTRAAEFGVSERCLGRRLLKADLVQLRAVKPRPVFDRFERKLVRGRAKRIYFTPSEETEKWSEQLQSYNEFTALHEVNVTAPDELIRSWIEETNQDEFHDGACLKRPELFRNAIYRVFNDGSSTSPTFEKGGRLVGGWWISAPEELRRHICINGKPTVELDFAACHPRMLYHKLGIEAPKEPYDIPDVIEIERRDGCEPGTYRPFVKWLTQILINGRGRPDLVSVPSGLAVPPNAPLLTFTEIIEHWHAPIASTFRSGAGLSLMKAESEIALAIVTHAKEEGWLALPIHDSFVAPVDKEAELRAMMVNAYREIIGKEPTIRSKAGTPPST